MKPQEALRLAKACLHHQGDDDTAIITSLTERSVSARRVCSLWSGMGSIYHLQVVVAKNQQHRLDAAVKYVPLADPQKMRDFGERRKAVAYQVEANFYERAAPHFCKSLLQLPQLYHMERPDDTDDASSSPCASSGWVAVPFRRRPCMQ